LESQCGGERQFWVGDEPEQRPISAQGHEEESRTRWEFSLCSLTGQEAHSVFSSVFRNTGTFGRLYCGEEKGRNNNWYQRLIGFVIDCHRKWMICARGWSGTWEGPDAGEASVSLHNDNRWGQQQSWCVNRACRPLVFQRNGAFAQCSFLNLLEYKNYPSPCYKYSQVSLVGLIEVRNSPFYLFFLNQCTFKK
jgi:hypothetical protein